MYVDDGERASLSCQGWLSPKQVAIKFLERGAGVNKSVLREILNHRLCVVHPNIVQFREIFLTPGAPGHRHGVCGGRGHV